MSSSPAANARSLLINAAVFGLVGGVLVDIIKNRKVRMRVYGILALNATSFTSPTISRSPLTASFARHCRRCCSTSPS